jgi:hypothetical protein
MKKIQPVSIWKNGEQLEACLLNSTSQDNLLNSCTFYYQLLAGGDGTESMPISYGQTIADGSLSLFGEDYLAWDGTNDAAYVYIAEKLNLTLI